MSATIGWDDCSYCRRWTKGPHYIIDERKCCYHCHTELRPAEHGLSNIINDIDESNDDDG